MIMESLLHFQSEPWEKPMQVVVQVQGALPERFLYPMVSSMGQPWPVGHTCSFTPQPVGALICSFFLSHINIHAHLIGIQKDLALNSTWIPHVMPCTISFLGSVAVLIESSITGPSLIVILLLFQQAGWLMCVLAFQFYSEPHLTCT